jgi:hypothetical protein
MSNLIWLIVANPLQLLGYNFVNAIAKITDILQNLVNCTHTKTYEHTYLWLTGYKERGSAFAA